MDAFKQFAVRHEGLTLYYAGLPRFESIFLRDIFLAGMLANNNEMLKDALIFAARTQATQPNTIDGAEPGKILHEYNLERKEGYPWRPVLLTTYNACDTTALYLLAHEHYAHTSYELVYAQQQNIHRAVDYILDHVHEGFFMEQPPQGADRFALHTTYWKDSVLPTRAYGDPAYPIVYTLAHTQNMRALKAAQRLLQQDTKKKRELVKRIERTTPYMQHALQTLFDEENDCFLIGRDQKGPLQAVSSDTLHVLAYVEPSIIPTKKLERIVHASAALETPIGYRTLAPAYCADVIDRYHTHTVWPVEQAVIHQGATNLGQAHIQTISARMHQVLTKEQNSYELYEINDRGEWEPGGQPQQLWTVAAAQYFRSLAQA